MTNDEKARNDFENADEIDVNLTDDDELANLFAAFDEVSASDELQANTLERIIGTKEEATAEEAPLKAVAGDRSARANRKAKWRAIRVAALAACLALALTGGVAYATPASYYEVEQAGTTITLGVNCFGIAVSATSSDEAGKQVIEEASLQNLPYEEAISRAVEHMEMHNPEAPVEYGPQGGEREVVSPAPQPQPQPGQQPGPQPGQQPEAQLGQQPEQQPDQQPESQPESQPQPDATQPQGGAQPASQPDGSPEGGSPGSDQPPR